MITTQEFLHSLYRYADGIAEIRLIHKSGDHRQAKKIYRPANEIHTGNFQSLSDANKEYHIYHRVNVSSTQDSKKANISQIVALYVDVDDNSQEAYNRLERMKYPPTAIIASGGGYHGYWMLRKPVLVRTPDNIKDVERTMQGMIFDYGAGADEKAKDVTRILRTPGFYNIKDEYDPKPLCNVVYLDDDSFGRYNFHELYKLYAPLGTPEKPKIRRLIPTEALSKDLPKYVSDYIASGAPEGERNHRLYVSARFYLDAGKTQYEAEQDLLSRAQMDGLTASEARNTINSAFRNSPNPKLDRTMQARYAIGDSKR